MRSPSIALLSFVLIPVIVMMACKQKENTQPATNPAQAAPRSLPVDIMIASPQGITADIEVPGTILANEVTTIHPEVAGRLVTLNLREGAEIPEGTLIAKLNDGDLQAQMRKLEVQLKIAEQTESRQAELVKIQGISQQDYDMSLLQVLSLKADIDIIKEEIRKTEIRAPFSGRLGLKNVSPGAYVTPSTTLTTISQTNTLKIQFNVPERYGAKLQKGMSISFSVDGSPVTFTATVIASETRIDEATRSLAIRAVINQRDRVLIPGAFAKVRIVLNQNNDALMIPNSVIIPSGRKKQVYLFKNGKALPIEVVTGVRDSSNIQVLSGLNDGDTIITSAILFLRPGLDVAIKNQ